MEKNRYLRDHIVEDLREKMVFIGGPRQVGKTTLAKKLIGARFRDTAYFNWDNRQDRRRIITGDWPGTAELIILDEIHKYRGWKNFIKGEFDTLKERYKFLITGSARLDLYRKGGDSLQGRYHYYRLHPFSIAELLNGKSGIEIFREIPIPAGNSGRPELALLDEFGGFPEPVTRQNRRLLRRWHNERIDRLFREDIRDIEAIRDMGNMQLLADLLPQRVASLLSINSLREDLGVSHRAVTNWLNILETFYYHFRIYPYTGKIIRSIKKESKLYLWDWSEVSDQGARFENMVACHLLKLVHFLHDYEGYRTKLRFLRNVDKKEVDFLVTVDEKPWFAVEVKVSDKNISPSLRYFKERMEIPFLYQVIKEGEVDRFRDGVRVVSAHRFLGGLI